MKDLQKLDSENIWHPYTSLAEPDPPLLVTSAKGVHFETADGRKIIDAISSWWVNLHGHSRDEIAQAISSQASRLEHIIFAGFTHEPAITLSGNLLSILPANQSKIFYSDNGSTAVEVALKIAIQYWRNQGKHKNNIIALEGAYHGDTFGAMSVGARGLFTGPFAEHLFPVYFVDLPQHHDASSALTQFKKLIARKDIAAFIYEPLVQGASGMRMYPAELLDEMITLAQQHDILCIADEVFTGFGRTGKIFASDHLQTEPDLITLSKGLTGGALPLGVTSCSRKVVNAFMDAGTDRTLYHGHSYTANPLACAAANASFDLLMKEECQKQIEMISSLHAAFAQSILEHPKTKEVRTLGTILAIEVATGESSSYTHPLRRHIYRYFLQRDILLRPLGNVLYILPPYVITKDELRSIYNTIRRFLDDMK